MLVPIATPRVRAALQKSPIHGVKLSMSLTGLTRLTRLVIGACLALLIHAFCVSPSAQAGCSHPAGSGTHQPSGLSTLDPQILGEFLEASPNGQGADPSRPDRRFPCSGPSCSGNVPLPASPLVLAADRLDQWGTLSNLFGFLPVVPRLTRISDTTPRPIGQPAPIFHPPRTNRSMVL